MAISQALDTALRGCVPDSAGATELIDMLDAIDVLAAAELAFIDGVTAGTAASSKALVLGANKEIGTISSATINAATLSNLSVDTGLTAAALNVGTGGAVLAGSVIASGATSGCASAASAFSSAVSLSRPVNLISVGTAVSNYFRLPVASVGLMCNVVNVGGSTVGLIGNTSGVSIAGATSTALATAKAPGAALDLVCDGTDWHQRGAVDKNLVADAFTAGSAVISTNMTVRSVLSASSITGAAGNITAFSAANAVFGTNITVSSVMSASSITGAAANITNLTATAQTAVSLNVGTGGLVNTGAPGIVAPAILQVGGSAATASLATTLGAPVNLISVSDAAKNYFKMPAVAVGKACNVINLGSTAGLLGNAGESIASATSAVLATADAVGSALDLICDGTNWWKQAK
jgi:hypothetical protein